TVTVNNAGPATATAVTVQDVLPSGLQDVSDDSAGAFNNLTGTWTVGDITSGGSATLHITATVLASGSYTNYAQVLSSGTLDPDSLPGDNSTDQDDDDSVTLTPVPVADLSLTKVADTTTPNVGGNVGFTVTVHNSGPSAATGVTVSDLLPSGLQYVSDDSAGAYSAGVWNIGSIANG